MCAPRRVGVFFVGLFLSVGAPAADYPLKASADGRYLVDSNNAPFLVVGDAPHSLIANLSDADAAAYLSNRASNGVNSIWVEALCVAYTGGRADGSMLDGTTPFTNTIAGGYWDLTTPREAYWSHVDYIVQTAAANGIQVLLTPLDEGGLSDTALANGTSRCRQYGQFLGNRYKNSPNIFWQDGNDFQNWRTASYDAVITSIALGIKDNDTNHIHTIQLDYPISDSLEDPNWWPIVSVNGVYTYYPTYDECLVAYNRANYMPVLFLEEHYEYENVSGEMGAPNVLRRQEYWSLLSGSLAGHLYGNYYTWTFSIGWQSHLNSPGMAQLGYFEDFFSTRDWYQLVPDQAHMLLTAGYGTYATRGNVSASDYATAARTPDGALAICYLPTVRTITVDMTQMAGTTMARWFDPSAGIYSTVGGLPFTNTGTRTFTPPGNNSAGDGDWALVLETQSSDTQAPAVTLTAPLGGATVSNTTPISATATDNVAVVGLQFQVDGTNLGAELGSAPYTKSWDTLTVSNGTHSVRAVARDEAGNLATNGVLVTVSNTIVPPLVVPVFVQQNYATPQSPQTQVAVAYPKAQAAGNANLIAIGWDDTSSSISAVSDSAGNLYQAAVPMYRGNGLSQAIYYSTGIKAGSNTVSVSFDQPAVYVDLRVTEYSGLAPTNTLDQGNSGTGTGTSASSGTVTTTTTNELLFGAGFVASAFTAAGAGFTARVITSPDADIVEDMVASVPGSYAATGATTGGAWMMQVAAFKAMANSLPVAGLDTIQRWATTGTKVAIASLLSNDSDPNGYPIGFVSASATSTNGGLVTQQGGWVFYDPLPGFTNADSFTYTITNSLGLTAIGTVLVNVRFDTLPSPNLTITNLGGGSYLILFDGVPSATYAIEYAESPTNTLWQALGAATADPFGFFEFADTPPGSSGQRFYRSVWNP